MHEYIRTSLVAAVFAVFLLFSSEEAKAQRLAVSTDALEWLVLSPNLAFDASIAQHHTMSISFSTSPFEINDNFWMKHISVTPEYKYWFTMPFYGHYLGGDVSYVTYELARDGVAKRGNVVAMAANYGFSFIMSRRWNIVPNAGLGGGVEFSGKARFVPVIRLGVNIQMLIR